MLLVWRGEFERADAVIGEADVVTKTTSTRLARSSAVLLGALRGREVEAASLIESTTAEARAAGQGIGVQFGQWAASILLNGACRYEEALAAAREVTTTCSARPSRRGLCPN